MVALIITAGVISNPLRAGVLSERQEPVTTPQSHRSHLDCLNRRIARSPWGVAMHTTTIEPISVGTKTAWHLMAVSNAHGYKLIEQGEIDSYREGRVRKATVASIKAYIARKLVAAKKDTTPVRTEKATAASVSLRAQRQATGAVGRRGPRSDASRGSAEH